MRQYRHVRIVPPRRRCRQQSGGFLSKYGFAYAGRDTVNQAYKNLNSTAPALMKQLTDQVNIAAQQTLEQAIIKVGKKSRESHQKLLEVELRTHIKHHLDS